MNKMIQFLDEILCQFNEIIWKIVVLAYINQ